MAHTPASRPCWRRTLRIWSISCRSEALFRKREAIRIRYPVLNP
jgi:hypothetical protein